MAPDGEPSARGRPSIEERAARRDRIEHGAADRYTSLMRALYAGQEVPWGRRRAGRRLEWHPIAWTLLRFAAAVAVGYLVLSFALNAWRDGQVDTWAGPDTTVSSGQRLADCPAVNRLHHDTFPTWIRFQGSVYGLTEFIRPVGDNVRGAYADTGYTNGKVRMWRITDTPDGVSGRTILLKLDDSPTGQLFRRLPDCS